MRAADLKVTDLAKAAGMTESALWALAKNMDGAFCPTRRKRVHGKLRDIDAPKPHAKRVLRRIHRYLQRTIRAHPGAHGGAKSRSCFTSARLHLGRRYVVTRDVRDCYPSISQAALRERLLQMGFRADTSLILSLLCTVRGRLAQGSPVSADALNLFFYDADRALSAACSAAGARYSRTYDDMVISVESPRLAEWPGDAMRRHIEGHGLSINATKLHRNGFQPRHREQRVHNLVVNNKRGVRIRAEQAAKATRLAEAYLRGARVVSPDSLEALACKHQEVEGWMHYTRMADFGPARHIRRLLEAGDRCILRALTARGLIAHRNKWWVMSKRRNEPRRLARAWRASQDDPEGLSA